MDPVSAIGVVSKIIGLGIKGWSALGERELSKDDLEALRTLLDTSASILATRQPQAATAGALHLALIARAFGRAVGRHQEFHGKLRLTAGLRRWVNRVDREREEEIQQRVKLAVLALRQLGNDLRGDVDHITALTAHPLGTPYYRELWRAFSDPGLTIEEAGELPPLDMSSAARREFERYFLLAYLEGARSGTDEYLEGLKQYQAELVRDLLVSNLATWGQCHVFGNVPREAWNDGESVPFMPLDDVYVEPSGHLERDGKPDHREPAEPLLALLERLTAANAAPRIIVVTADFGNGKSLSARTLARRWAEQFLSSASGTSLDLRLPIHVRCAEDFPSETVDLELTVRHAWKRQASAIGYAVSADDRAFAWPNPEQHVVCLLDGLDEVALGEQHLKTLFQKLGGKTSRKHRFVIFTRPGAISLGPISSRPIFAGPISSGPFSARPISVGPISVGPISVGPISVGPISVGPISVGPISVGPISVGPISASPISTGPNSVGPISAGPISARPFSARPVSAGPIYRVPRSSMPRPIKQRCGRRGSIDYQLSR